MNTEGWIDITEYAVKYRVSQSTLRRRIRSNTIAFRMDRGKYLLLDSSDALNKAPLFSRQSFIRQSSRPEPAAQQTNSVSSQSWNTNLQPTPSNNDLRRLQAENKMLREQLAEAETLVKVLESELQSFSV